MIRIAITDPSPRRWWHLLRRRRWDMGLPERWCEVTPPRRRHRWLRWLVLLPPVGAQRAILRDMLKALPARVRAAMPGEDIAAIAGALSWAKAEPDCEHMPVTDFTHKGRRYVFPRPKGQNIACIEFPLADDYYNDFISTGNAESLTSLLATIARVEDTDAARSAARGDKRVPLHSRDEVERSAALLRNAPVEVHMAALLYFAGLKAYINRLYGPWLFDSEEEESDPEPTPESGARAKGPDFGWWGIYQQVAESGVFGDLERVYQASLHDVCIYLVRKRVEADATRAQIRQSSTRKNYD